MMNQLPSHYTDRNSLELIVRSRRITPIPGFDAVSEEGKTSRTHRHLIVVRQESSSIVPQR